MKITFLGTSAGEEYPGAWCECENCAKAREWGGKNIRRNSCAVIDGDIMIEMGKTAHIQAERFNINLRKIKTLLLTHSHGDHLSTHTLWSRQAVHGFELPELNIFGSRQVYDFISADDKIDLKQAKINFNIVEPFNEYHSGDLKIYTLDGRHDDRGSNSVNYIITRKNIAFAYLSDTGYPFDKTLEAIKNYKYDFIITEGTSGLGGSPDNNSHMNIEDNTRLLEFFSADNLWKNTPDYYVTHVAPHWCPPHDEYAPLLEAKGLKLAYDGLVIEYPYKYN
jgi:phosphoribosyl 1,2-cyclic phosphate phosphodiesterase